MRDPNARLKTRARTAVGNAIRDGRLQKGPCAQAGDDCAGRVEAHHADYAVPLAVTWLCRHHHAAETVRLGQSGRPYKEGPCPKGHESNWYVWRGWRICRTCRTEYQRDYYQRVTKQKESVA